MRAVFLYLVLVGFPVLGILGLLRVGQTLSAPSSLAGRWNAQLGVPTSLVSSAGDPLIHPGATILSITQSGPQVLLTFDDIQKQPLIGTVQDSVIYARFVPESASDTSGLATAAIYFQGRIDRQTDQARLLGVLTFDRGPVRTEVPLTAVRQSESRATTGGH